MVQTAGETARGTRQLFQNIRLIEHNTCKWRHFSRQALVNCQGLWFLPDSRVAALHGMQQTSPEVAPVLLLHALHSCPRARLCAGQTAGQQLWPLLAAPTHLLPQDADVKILPLPSKMQGGPCTASASPQANRLLFKPTILKNLPPLSSLLTRNSGFSCVAIAPQPLQSEPTTQPVLLPQPWESHSLSTQPSSRSAPAASQAFSSGAVSPVRTLQPASLSCYSYICYLYNDDTLFSQHSWGVKSQLISSTEILWDALPGPSHMPGLEISIWCCVWFPSTSACRVCTAAAHGQRGPYCWVGILNSSSSTIPLPVFFFPCPRIHPSRKSLFISHKAMGHAVIVGLLSKNCSSASSPPAAALPPTTARERSMHSPALLGAQGHRWHSS